MYLSNIEIDDIINKRLFNYNEYNLNSKVKNDSYYRSLILNLKHSLKQKSQINYNFPNNKCKLIYIFLMNIFNIETNILLTLTDLIYLTKYSLIIDDINSFNKWFNLLDNTSKMHILYNVEMYNIDNTFKFGYPYKINKYLMHQGYDIILLPILINSFLDYCPKIFNCIAHKQQYIYKRKNIKFGNIKLVNIKYNITEELIFLHEKILNFIKENIYITTSKYIKKTFIEILSLFKELNLINDDYIIKILPKKTYILFLIKNKLSSCFDKIVNKYYKQILLSSKYNYGLGKLKYIICALNDNIFIKNIIWFNNNFIKCNKYQFYILRKYKKLNLLNTLINLNPYNIIIKNTILNYISNHNIDFNLTDEIINTYIKNKQFNVLLCFTSNNILDKLTNYVINVINKYEFSYINYKSFTDIRSIIPILNFIKKININNYNYIIENYYLKFCKYYFNTQIKLTFIRNLDLTNNNKYIYTYLKKYLNRKYIIRSVIEQLPIDIHKFINLYKLSYKNNNKAEIMLKKIIKYKYKLQDNEIINLV